MPNDCENRLIISHPDIKMITRLENALNNEKFLEEFLPTPPILLNKSVPTEYGWYDWRVENWGTKWDVYNIDFNKMDSNRLEINFLSAWSPPIKAYQSLENLGFVIDGWYNESGMCFCGTYSKGKNITYNYCNEEEVPKELDEYFKITNTSDDEEEDEED